jgi:hypothetical protein
MARDLFVELLPIQERSWAPSTRPPRSCSAAARATRLENERITSENETLPLLPRSDPRL